MKLSNFQQELSRTKPQQTEMFLHVFQPRIIMQCRVNDASIDKGSRVITYDTVSLGNFNAVEDGMTLLVGSSAGARDRGKIRIRSATSTQFTVSENSNIAWKNNSFLTVLRFIEVWPIFPRIIQDPSNPEDVIFYKDYDIAYSNQNTVLGALICAGPHKPVLLDPASGVGRAYYSASGTTHLIGSGLSYNWAFEGGSPTGSTSATPGYVNYSTAGDYVTRLTVSGSNGSIDRTYRYVSVRSRPGEGASSTVQRWESKELSGSRAEGGYKMGISIYDSMTINEGDLIMISTDDWYGDTKISIGGNAENASSTFFVGYAVKDTIRYDYKAGRVDFEVSSVTDIMKSSEGFSVSVESKASPTKWYELLNMDGKRAIYHYLKWHSTILLNTDVQFLGTDRQIQYFDADRASLYDSVDNFMRGALIGEVVADRQGKIWAEVQAEATPSATGTYIPIMELTNRDWLNQISILDSISGKVSYMEYGGIAYSGPVTGTFSALLADAPGNAPEFRGKVERLTGLALAGQSQLNELVGNMYANKNTKFSFNLDMSANYRQIDIAPQEAMRMLIAPTDSPRNISLDTLVLPKSISWEFDPVNLVHKPRLDGIVQLVSGLSGDTIPVPDISDIAGGGYNIPNQRLPTIPPFILPSFLNKSVFTIASAPLVMDNVFVLPFQFSATSLSGTNAYDFNRYFSFSTTYLVVNLSGYYFIDMYVKVVTNSGATPWSFASRPLTGSSNRRTWATSSITQDQGTHLIYLNAGDLYSPEAGPGPAHTLRAEISIIPIVTL